MIGKLKRVPLRDVWKHEALDFTRWLEENIDVMNEELGLDLSNVERERAAGSFNVDLIAEDRYGNLVVIENQLEKSDHDHLGKLITYLTALEAKTAVWIVAQHRPEHVKAVAWLNESSSADFYLVQVEAVQIGESPPAPLLNLIVGPSDDTRGVKATKQDLAQRHVERIRFWEGLLAKAKEKTSLHANVSAGKDTWISAGAGKSGLAFTYGIRQHDAHVEFFIDRGKEKVDENELIFDALYNKRDEIDGAFGEPLDWQRLEGRQSCRIRMAMDIGGYRDEERFEEVWEWLADAMARLEQALKPHIGDLPV